MCLYVEKRAVTVARFLFNRKYTEKANTMAIQEAKKKKISHAPIRLVVHFDSSAALVGFQITAE